MATVEPANYDHTIADQIKRLQKAKSDLKTAIESKGVTVPDNTSISDYAQKVNLIEQGGGGSSNSYVIVGAFKAVQRSQWTLDGDCTVEFYEDNLWHDVFSSTPSSSGYYYYRVKCNGSYEDGTGVTLTVGTTHYGFLYDPVVGTTMLEGFL